MLLIDTYNVLHVTGILPPHLAGVDMSGLAALIATSRWKNRQTLLVCDGTGGGVVRSRTLTVPLPAFPHIVALFAGPGHDADTALERCLEADSAPRGLLVVSSDNRLKAAARRKRAHWLSSEAFLEKLVHDEGKGVPKPRGERKTEPLDREEIRAWLRAFDLDDTLVEGVVPEADPPTGLVEGSAPGDTDRPVAHKDDAIMRQAQEEWPGRVDPDDLDMHRWLDKPDNPDSAPDS